MRSQLARGRPSNNTSPVDSGQIPIITRASVDLPEPDGPTITVTLAGFASRLTPCKMGVSRPSAVAVTSRKAKAPVGATRVKAGSRSGWFSSSSSSRPNAERAPMNERQIPTSASIGASALVVNTLAAIMAPGESCPSITSKAPAAKAKDCWQ